VLGVRRCYPRPNIVRDHAYAKTLVGMPSGWGGSGRGGLQDWFIRLTGSVGLKNAETEMKDRYEEALRAGNTVIAILAPRDDRKERAAQILNECGGRIINWFGRLDVERIAR
jgi:hypothetical protein